MGAFDYCRKPRGRYLGTLMPTTGNGQDLILTMEERGLSSVLARVQERYYLGYSHFIVGLLASPWNEDEDDEDDEDSFKRITEGHGAETC